MKNPLMSIATLAALGFVFSMTGCEDDGVEEVGEEIEEAADEVGDAVEDAGDEVKDAVDDAKD